MSESQPRLRDDLRITPLTEGGDNIYVIEDPLRNMFFKIGLREYRFLCRLPGVKNQAAPSSDKCDELSNIDVSEEEALSILQWLAAKQLLQNQSQEIMQAIETGEHKARQKSLLSRLNIITFRVSIFNPDPWLDCFLPWLRWLAGPFFFVCWTVLGCIAVALLLGNWTRFISENAGFFSPINVVIVSLIWILLKLLHELSHALACKRHGGGVYDFGVLFILFIPLTYVNATTSWGFSSRWQRIHVAVSGIYMELFIAWLAAIYWATHINTTGGLIAHNTVLVAGVSSLLFNANPLMRFDGYFVLSDLTSIPNLYFRGLDAVRRVLKKYLLGIDETRQGLNYSLFVKLYGFAVYCWRFVVLCSLSILASKMFSGWGLLLSIAAVAGWLYQPIAGFFANISDFRAANPRFLSHFLKRIVLVSLLGGSALFGISWEKTISIPAVVAFEEQYTVRAETSGFIQEIFVKTGAHVQPGEQLIQLSNEELESQGRTLALDLKKITLQKRVLHGQGRYGELQILEDRKEVLAAQKRNLDEDKKGLLVRAPGGGRVVGEMLENKIGTLAQKGEELLLVVHPEHKHLVASVEQNDIAALQQQIEGEVLVDMTAAGLGNFTGQIQKIIPGASKELIHFSFAAPFGGPFDVQTSTKGGYQLFTPRFAVYISIPESLRPALYDGQQAVVKVKDTSRSLAAILWQRGKSWLLERNSR